MKRIIFSTNECEALLEASLKDGWVAAELDDERVQDIEELTEVNGTVLGQPVAWKKKNGGETIN